MSTDGQTEGRMDGRTHYYSPLPLMSGDNYHQIRPLIWSCEPTLNRLDKNMNIPCTVFALFCCFTYDKQKQDIGITIPSMLSRSLLVAAEM